MSVATALKKLQGFVTIDQSDPVADAQDLFSDEIWLIPITLDAAAGTDYVYGSIKVPYNVLVVDATICPGAALTAADATANTLTLAKADGAGGSATTVASIVTNVASGNWVADTFKALTLSATAANRLVNDGQILTFKKTHAAGGTVTPASTLCIRVRKV
jgi:hypothetical protein